MNKSGTWAVLSQTFKESIRAKWLLMFTAVFFLLALNVPTLVLVAARYLPENYLQTFVSTLVTVSFPLIPLLALPMGSTSLVDERESGVMQFVLSSPISKTEFLIGKAVGLLFATSSVVVLGFGIADLFVYSLDVKAYRSVASVMLVAVALNAMMVGLSLIISTLSKRKATALGSSIFIWFLLTVVTNVGFLSAIVAFNQGPVAVLPIILLNPVESARILAVLLLGGGYTELGNSGAIVRIVLGQSATAVLLATLIVWLLALFFLAFLAFNVRDQV